MKETIARVAHEINRAYCASMGDDSQLPWEEAPEAQRASIIAGVEMHLGNPDATPEQSHAAWLERKLAEGWVHGEVKDVEAKVHPCCVPYEQLPAEQKAKDYLFRAVVHQVERLVGAQQAAPTVEPAAAPATPIGFVAVTYIGRRESWTDRLYGSGLTFRQGQTRSVPGKLARDFLRHRDVFEEAAEAPAEPAPHATADDDTAEQLNRAKQREQAQQVEQTNVQDVMDAVNQMDKEALQDFAYKNYQQKIPKTLSLENMRAKAIQLIDQFGVV